MGEAETIEGVRAAVLPEELRVRLRLSADDLVDLKVTRRAPPPIQDREALDRAVARLQEMAEGSSVSSENCTNFLYDEDGLPA